MIWLQGGLAFVLWVAYGAWQSRRPDAYRAFAEGKPQGTRGLMSAGLLLAAIALLFASLQLLFRLGGFGAEGMTFWAWCVVAAVGLAFVHLQTLALALMLAGVARPVTPSASRASTNSDSDEKQP